MVARRVRTGGTVTARLAHAHLLCHCLFVWCVCVAVDANDAHVCSWGSIGGAWASVAADLQAAVPCATDKNCKAEWLRLAKAHRAKQARQQAASGTNEEYTDWDKRMEDLVSRADDVLRAARAEVGCRSCGNVKVESHRGRCVAAPCVIHAAAPAPLCLTAPRLSPTPPTEGQGGEREEETEGWQADTRRYNAQRVHDGKGVS